MLIAFIMSTSGSAFAADNSINDVPPNHWAYKAVKQLAAAGVIDGYNSNTFAGDKPASRYEVAKMIFNSLGNYEKATSEQKVIIDALKSEFSDVFNKTLDNEKRIAKLEAAQSKISYSGLLTNRYKNADYSQAGRASSSVDQYRIRLDVKTMVDADSFVGFRFTNRAPNMKDLWNDSFTNFGEDNDTDANSHNQAIDRMYYTTKVGNGAGSVTLGKQALVIDKGYIIMDSTYYSYDGAKISYKLKGLGSSALLDAQYGRFYKGATMVKLPNWGNKLASDFSSADIKSLILNGKNNNFDYSMGYADFRNNNIHKALLTYTFGNIGYQFNPKVYTSFDLANNRADNDGRFWAGTMIYGDKVPAKLGQWNVSLRYIDAQQNAIFNRFSMLEGGTGRNTNDPQKIWDARINYAFSPKKTLLVQRLAIDDTKAANNLNDAVIWKAQLDVKF